MGATATAGSAAVAAAGRGGGNTAVYRSEKGSYVYILIIVYACIKIKRIRDSLLMYEKHTLSLCTFFFPFSPLTTERPCNDDTIIEEASHRNHLSIRSRFPIFRAVCVIK